MPPFNTNRAETLASMDRFDRLGRNLRATVIIQHEPADVAKLPAFPAVGAMKALLSRAPGGPETLELAELARSGARARASCSSGSRPARSTIPTC